MNAKLEEYVEAGARAFQEHNYDDAERLLTLAAQEAEKSQDNLSLASVLDSLGEVCFDQGKFAEAEPYFKKALSLRVKQLAPEHEDVVLSISNLSSLYFYANEHAK